MAEEKVRVVRIKRPKLGAECICREVSPVVNEAHILATESEVGDRVVMEVDEMTREEYEALPEFAGW